jgi:hypothetical protein
MDLTKDEIVKMARECNLMAGLIPVQSQLERFATLCRAPLVAEVERLKQAHEINADTLNAMQVEIDDWKARALKAEQAGEPVAYIAWKDGKPCYEGDDAICEDAVWPVDSDDDRTSMPVCAALQPAAQESTSAVPVVEMMVEALASCTTDEGPEQEELNRARAALQAGQKYLKESGK